MIQAFYQIEPIVRNTPFRVLELSKDGTGYWRVVLRGGAEWGKTGEILKVVRVNGYDDGKPVFDRMYRDAQKSGWRPYVPQVALNSMRAFG